MNIAEALGEQATARPNVVAIIDTYRGRTRRLTFGELNVASARVAAQLQEHGLKPGETVLVFQPLSAELYIALAGVFRAGLVAMLLDPSVGRSHIERCCQQRSPSALIASPRAHLLRVVVPALRRVPLKLTFGSAVPGAISLLRDNRAVPALAICPCGESAPALVTFTSGSTGGPKAILRSHGFLLAQHRVVARNLELTPGESEVATLPVFILANLASGMTTLVPNVDLRYPGAVDPRPVIDQIDIHQPTRIAGSPALLERVADYCAGHRRTLDSLRRVYTGGGPVFPRVLRKLRVMAPRARVISVYGSTEAEPIAHIDCADIRDEELEAMTQGSGLLAGKPIAEIQLRILPVRWRRPIGPIRDDQFESACLPPRQVGEIVVSGAHTLPGYLNGQGHENAGFTVEQTRWHRTGDAGYLDGEGRLWLMGRCAARIDDALGTLYPFEVECAALSYPNVRRAAAVSHQGGRILAVELVGPHKKTDLTFLKSRFLSAHFEVVRVDRVPVDRRHNVKVDYPALRAILDSMR